MGIEEGPKRGSQAGRPCRLAAGLRLVAAPSSPRWRRAPPPLPRRTVLTQACPSLACPGRQVAERGALSALGLAFVPAPWGNCGLARPRQEWSVSGPSPQALSSDCCEGSSKAPAGSGRNGPGGLGWEAWSSPKRCWGRRQSRFFQPPPLPRLEMTERPPPPNLSGRFWRGEGTGVGKSRWTGPGMLASPTCPVQSSAWGHASF